MDHRIFNWIWFLRVWSFLGSLAGLIALWSVSVYDERLSMVTPIAVLDRSGALRALPVESDEGSRHLLMQRLETTAKKLSQEGFLVIDGGWVISAPEEVYVR